MKNSTDIAPVDGEDRRAPDDEQPLALAIAEAEGVLPEADRRHPDDVTLIGELQARLAEHPSSEGGKLRAFDQATLAILAKAGAGSVFTKTTTGWRISYITPGDIPVLVSGPTMPEALASHGLHVTHDAFGKEHAASEGPQHAVMELR